MSLENLSAPQLIASSQITFRLSTFGHLAAWCSTVRVALSVIFVDSALTVKKYLTTSTLPALAAL